MIPADHWHDNGDGMAWWVIPGPERWGWMSMLDRPCDTCNGDGFDPEMQPPIRIGGGRFGAQCPDCIDGRHTFTIEVAWQTEVDAYESLNHRVSIVPGMVLPLLDGGQQLDRYPSNAVYWTKGEGWWVDSDFDNIATLPPAAKPGMWAVKLRLSENVECRTCPNEDPGWEWLLGFNRTNCPDCTPENVEEPK